MRVIGGSARGRRLAAPANPAVRPTADKVREAMFDVLSSLDAITDANVLDLFAGSGALGIEALSRHAAKVTFVENDRAALATIEANLASTKLADPDRVALAPREAFSYLVSITERFDVAFCDPPYDFDRWPELLGLLPARLCVAESNREVDLGEAFQLYRAYRYGGTLVTVAMQVEKLDKDQA